MFETLMQGAGEGHSLQSGTARLYWKSLGSNSATAIRRGLTGAQSGAQLSSIRRAPPFHRAVGSAAMSAARAVAVTPAAGSGLVNGSRWRSSVGRPLHA